MRKFITPVSMKVTEKQYREDLEAPLREMGYSECYTFGNFKRDDRVLENISQLFHIDGKPVIISERLKSYKNYFIDDYNPKLYLALAAMSNVEEGVKGEYWKFTGNLGENFTKNKLYKANKAINSFGAFIDDNEMPNGYGYINHKYFTKATKDEIINHLSYCSAQKTYPLTPNETTENMILPTKDAQRIINNACPDWRDSLAKKWGANIVKNEPISISTEEYKKMRAACTPTQNDLFDEIFGKYETYPEVGTVCWVWSICRSNAHLAIHKGNGEYKICFNNGLGAVRQKNYEVLTENNK